jgi:hypothetical protein
MEPRQTSYGFATRHEGRQRPKALARHGHSRVCAKFEAGGGAPCDVDPPEARGLPSAARGWPSAMGLRPHDRCQTIPVASVSTWTDTVAWCGSLNKELA